MVTPVLEYKISTAGSSMERYDCCQSFINFVSSRINGNLFKYDFKGLLSKVQKCSINQKNPLSLKSMIDLIFGNLRFR